MRRREFLAVVGSSVALTGCVSAGGARARPGNEVGDEAGGAEVTPGEDLMQEHGVLERILLIYDEAVRRIDRHERLDPAVVASAAGIVRRFVEAYHEELEERFVFPRLQAARREEELVATLLRQHRRGREVTEDILRRAGAAASPELAEVLRSFARMYRPHAAREDTVLFPAFREVVGRAAYRELGEQFEDEEHERFGEHGFETTVAEIARLEAMLEIGDLARFTP
jgi:hemerythrin-like domain-containing protein